MRQITIIITIDLDKERASLFSNINFTPRTESYQAIRTIEFSAIEDNSSHEVYEVISIHNTVVFDNSINPCESIHTSHEVIIGNISSGSIDTGNINNRTLAKDHTCGIDKIDQAIGR